MNTFACEEEPPLFDPGAFRHGGLASPGLFVIHSNDQRRAPRGYRFATRANEPVMPSMLEYVSRRLDIELAHLKRAALDEGV